MGPFAQRGDSNALSVFGALNVRGEGCPKDYSKAVKFYWLAAERGNAVAQNHLGLMYQQGRGVQQNYALAIKLFNMAIAHNSGAAMSNLGELYKWGYGVPRDWAKGRDLADHAEEIEMDRVGAGPDDPIWWLFLGTE